LCSGPARDGTQGTGREQGEHGSAASAE
jgi:hypothetical protein